MADGRYHTNPNQERRDVIGRGLVLTRKQLLSPTEKGGTRQQAVAYFQRTVNDADAYYIPSSSFTLLNFSIANAKSSREWAAET